MSEAKPIKIPFDSFTLGAVVLDLQPFVGGKIQDIRQPSETELVLTIYANGSEGMFLISCHPNYGRAHFITKRVSNQTKPPVLCSTLRSRVEGGRLSAARQINGDRILELNFDSDGTEHTLIAELMGKHSNIILLDESRRILAASKWVGPSKSSRPIQSNAHYQLPPVMLATGSVSESPFLRKLRLANGGEVPTDREPVLSPGHGAYPVSMASLGLLEFKRPTISIALEQHFALAIPHEATEALRTSLLNQLNRALLSKEVAIGDLNQAKEAGGKASTWQRYGELILAYGGGIAPGSNELHAWDYDSSEVQIKLDPDLNFKDNANAYFEKAKKAKGRIGIVIDQLERISAQRSEILSMIEQVRSCTRLDELTDLHQVALSKRWLTQQAVPAAHKEDRPYAGHRIRELTAPGGYTVLYGENAESNDYLTLRVAKPNDLWLHVRGDTSAHVVILTRNQPDKVQAETLRYAAKIAVQNSKAKHAGYVSVDYTLKKYVRRPKSAAKGSAIYTHEKTIHIES